MGFHPYADTGYTDAHYIDRGYTDVGYTDVVNNIDPHTHGPEQEYEHFADQNPHIDSGAPPWTNKHHSSSTNAKSNGGKSGGSGTGTSGGNPGQGTFSDSSSWVGPPPFNDHADSHNDGASGSYTDGGTFVDASYSDHADSDSSGNPDDPEQSRPSPPTDTGGGGPLVGGFGDAEFSTSRTWLMGTGGMGSSQVRPGQFADGGFGGESRPTVPFTLLESDPFAFADDHTDSPQTTPDPSSHIQALLAATQARHDALGRDLRSLALVISAAISPKTSGRNR